MSTILRTFNESRLKNKALTATEAIKQAGLDYEIEQYPIAYRNKNGSHHQIAGRFDTANVHSKTKECLGVVGSGYQVIQNRDAFSFLNELAQSKDIIFTGAGQFRGGRIVWVSAKMPADMILFRDDVIEKGITFFNSHDGSLCLRGMVTPNRIFCTNQLTRLHSEVSIRHTVGYKSKVSEARRALGFSLDFYKAFEGEATAMGNKKLNERTALSYFNSVLDIDPEDSSSRKIETRTQLLNLWENGKGNDRPATRHSLWTAYNAVTEFSDHHATVREDVEEPSRTLLSSWTGTGARFKDKAYSEALELVSVRKN